MRKWTCLSLISIPLILMAAANLHAFEKKVVLAEAFTERC